MNRTIKILLTVAIVGGSVAYLMSSSLEAESAVYKYVHELMAEPNAWVGKDVKAHGYVEAGSIKQTVTGHTQTTSFTLENEGKSLRIVTTEPMPDTFKDLAEVIAHGKLEAQPDGSYSITATEIMAKCPSKYEENTRTKSLTGAP